MDLLFTGVDQSQTDQPNALAEAARLVEASKLSFKLEAFCLCTFLLQLSCPCRQRAPTGSEFVSSITSGPTQSATPSKLNSSLQHA
eukprot:1161210-Pelagomonas_calceolata.AAC.6